MNNYEWIVMNKPFVGRARHFSRNIVRESLEKRKIK